MYFTVEFVHKTCGIICGIVFACSLVWFVMTDSDASVNWSLISGFGLLTSMFNYYKWQSPTYLNYREWMEYEKSNRK